jgi:2-C-methyl-D-erythritol 4-phosphate cytidylyltransferase/2-C-methyl-D-erythritol 2,4-cyclodiphosphate synthase
MVDLDQELPALHNISAASRVAYCVAIADQRCNHQSKSKGNCCRVDSTLLAGRTKETTLAAQSWLAFSLAGQYLSSMTSQQKFPQHIAAIVVAAGRGERAGTSGGPKQYRSIGGVPIIARTLAALLEEGRIERVVVAIHRDDAKLFREATGSLPAIVSTVIGGATRQESVRLALEALSDTETDAVLIHDAVRPFVSTALLDRIIDVVGADAGVCPALALVETIKRGSDGLVSGTVDRAGLFAAQTPQAFPYAAIREAHDRAAAQSDLSFTDDAAIAEWAGLPVRLVDGDAANVKITYPRDIEMANAKLSTSLPDVRTGNGYDVHALEPGDAVTLCGVRIPHDQRLVGHSDADVALHALTDALLATCGASDIGVHFPPSEARWKGVASSIFVEHAVKLIAERRGRIANVDITLICEAPRIGPHREAMVAALKRMLGIAPDRISIKATTNEGLGFVGRQEGIAAIATATVVFPGSLPA